MRAWALPLLWLALAGAAPVFDATAAWTEFTDLLRSRYAYLDRPGVDGEAILHAFAPRARAAPDRAAFLDVLQLVAHNFADPHFIVGPLDDRDSAVVPTSSDLHAERTPRGYAITDVRHGGDAEAQGVVPGGIVQRIDGRSTDAAIEQVMGRPLAALSPVQVDAGLDIALAGIRKQPRRLTISGRDYSLAPGNALAARIGEGPPLTVERRPGAAIIRINNSLGDNATITAFRSALASALDVPRLVIDLRNTPSGGNTTVARGIMGHFIRSEHAYQVHVVPGEAREFGVPRKFVEYVLPIAPFYPGKLVVLGGHWTGSMGEGLMIGFDALGVPTAGSRLAHLLGALSNETLDLSGAKVDIGEEALFHVDGRPREAFVPRLYRARAEAGLKDDPLLAAAVAQLR